MEPARIFVVDDQLAMAETIADSLSDLGYDAIALDSSVSAAARLASERVDLLITDLRMPQMDGLALLERSLSSDSKRPVIVSAITSNPWPRSRCAYSFGQNVNPSMSS